MLPRFSPLMPAGPDFRHTNFSDGRGCPHFTYTNFFWLPSPSQFSYTHFFGLPSPSQFTYTNVSGCRQWHPVCILATHTFRVAGVLQFTYTVVHTLSGRFWRRLAKNDRLWKHFAKKFVRGRSWRNYQFSKRTTTFTGVQKWFLHRVFVWGRSWWNDWFSKRPLGFKNEGDDLTKSDDFQMRNLSSVLPLTWLQHFVRSGLHHLIDKWGNDLTKNAQFQKGKLSLVCHFIWKMSAHG